MVDPARYRIEQRTVTTSEWVPAEGPETCACHARPGAPCVCPPVTEKRWQAMDALLSEQLEEARKWHLAAVKEKRAAQADAERLFTALDGYIMARITGTDLRDYDDLAERAARAHRAMLSRLARIERGDADA